MAEAMPFQNRVMKQLPVSAMKLPYRSIKRESRHTSGNQSKPARGKEPFPGAVPILECPARPTLTAQRRLGEGGAPGGIAFGAA